MRKQSGPRPGPSASASKTRFKEKRTDGHKEQIGPEMEKDMLITMRRPAFQSVLDKEASLVTQADIEAIRDKVKADAAAKGQSGISPSNKIITHTRAVLEYCGSHNHALSGVDGRYPWWRMLTTKYKNPTRTPPPPPGRGGQDADSRRTISGQAPCPVAPSGRRVYPQARSLVCGGLSSPPNAPMPASAYCPTISARTRSGRAKVGCWQPGMALS